MNGNNDRDSAERACFSYLQEHIGGVEDENAKLGNFLGNDKTEEWCFQLGRQNNPVVNYGYVGGAITWTVNGDFVGHFRNRTRANEVIDLIVKASPARNIEPNVTVFNCDDCYPETITIKDTDTGIECIVTRVTGVFFVVYSKTSKEE